MIRFLRCIKKYLKRFKCYIKYSWYKYKCKKRNKEEFIIFNVPLHANIGDHAIICAEEELLNSIDITPFLISIGDGDYYLDIIKKYRCKNTIISITGGGFVGSEWMMEMNIVNKVIDVFYENKIIIFPQTIYFKDDTFGKDELKKSKKIFDKALDLNIFTREKTSYEFAKKVYVNSNIYLVPDIVLLLSVNNYNVERENILLCLRCDPEGIFSENNKKKIKDIIKNKNLVLKETDTVVNYGINSKNRKNEIVKKLIEFASSKIVITDRLHGMIFALITKTPCIVFSNYNYKIKGVYEWIKHHDYIRYCDNIKDLDKNLDDLLEINVYCDYQKNKKDFQKLLEVLKGEK